MKVGTKIHGQLISDDRFLKGASDIYSAISAQRSSLKTSTYNTGIEIYSLSEERKLKFSDGTNQIRQDFILVMTKPLTKNDAYQIVNSVRAQPLKFTL